MELSELKEWNKAINAIWKFTKATQAVAPDKRGDTYWTKISNEADRLTEEFETLDGKYRALAPKYGKHGPIENALTFILAVAASEIEKDPQDAA